MIDRANGIKRTLMVAVCLVILVAITILTLKHSHATKLLEDREKSFENLRVLVFGLGGSLKIDDGNATVDLTDTNATDQEIAKISKYSFSITNLILDGNQVTDNAISIAAKFPSLCVLSLERTRVTGSTFDEFPPNSMLSTVMLSRTMADDAAVRNLLRLKRVAYLDIRESNVSPAIIDSLLASSSLKQLFIGSPASWSTADIQRLRRESKHQLRVD